VRGRHLAALAGLLAACASPVADRRPAVASDLAERQGAPAGDGEGVPACVTLDDGLDEEEAVALALWRNAAFLEALAGLGLARADVERAGLLANPVLSVLFPLGPKQLELTASMPLELLWLRPARVKAAELDHRRQAEALVRGGTDVVRDVRLGYAELRRLRAHAAVAAERTANRRRAAELVAARVAAGDLPEADAALAAAAAQEASIAEARATGAVARHEERLRELVGLDVDARATPLVAGEGRGAPAPPPLDALLAEAHAARPDVRAAELAVEAAGASADAVERDVVRLAGILDANEKDSGGLEVGPGLGVELPVFGTRRGPERTRAAAAIEAAGWRLVGTHRAVEREVREALLAFQQSGRALEATEDELLPRLQAAVEAARRVVELGDAAPDALLDAEARWIEARAAAADARAEREFALAALEHTLGRRIE